MSEAVPAWLIGRWEPDAERLRPEVRARLVGGVIEVRADGLSYFGFPRESGILDATWTHVDVSAPSKGLICLWGQDFDEVHLTVRERTPDRIRAYLGGMDAMPWGHEMWLARKAPG